MRRCLAVVVTALALCAGPGLATAYAAESAGGLCAEGEGISVVVDPGDLGGEVREACVPSEGSELATQVFADAGVEVTPVGAFPGAACRVDGQPQDVACQQMPPADAYWGLFLAQPDGSWDYAPTGADELELTPGDYVAFAWQTGSEATPPSVEAVPGEGQQAGQDQAADEGQEQSTEDGGLPVWVLVVVGGVLLAGLALVVVRRRRSPP